MKEGEVGCTFTFPQKKYWRFKIAISTQKKRIKFSVNEMIDNYIHAYDKLCEEAKVEKLAEAKETTIEMNEFIRRNGLDGV